MKTLSIYAAIFFSIFATNFSFAQKSTVLNHNATIKVWGVCESCKNRIESAALSAGALKANWDEKTHILALNYNGAKTSSEKIQKAIAAAGHDTQYFTADDIAYNKLPACCQYERKDMSKVASSNCCSMDNCTGMKDDCMGMACCNGKACKKS